MKSGAENYIRRSRVLQNATRNIGIAILNLCHPVKGRTGLPDEIRSSPVRLQASEGRSCTGIIFYDAIQIQYKSKE